MHFETQECFPLSSNYPLQTMSQNQSDWFDSAPWLVLGKIFVFFSQYKRDITRMVVRSLHYNTHLKTNVTFNNKTLKTINNH